MKLNLSNRTPEQLLKLLDSVKVSNLPINEKARLIEDMDYDYFKCMNETLKEIESRKGAFNSESGKWEKFKDDESKKLWYKADYKSCKL